MSRWLRVVMVMFLGIPMVASSAQGDSLVGAEITFYSNGSQWTAFMPDAKHAMFIGILYDGDQKIGFVQPKKFLTLHLAPGPHTFSASFGKGKPDQNTRVSLDMADGKQYFIRVQGESKGVTPFTSNKNRLDVVTCEIAQKESANLRPTDLKHVAPEMRGKIASVSVMPQCR